MPGSGGDRPPPTAQTYVERSPIPALAGVVSSVWIQHVGRGADPYVQRNVPNGSVEILCALGAAPRVVGPLTAPLVEVLEPGTTIAGLRLHPGAGPALLGLPASELVDLAVGADDVWGGAVADELGELAASAGSPDDALDELQRRLAARSADAAAPDPLVAEAVRHLRWRTDDVASLTASLHISERQLRRRCQAATGLAPKPLHRMLRFQRFLALAQHAIAHGRTPTDDGLASLAAETGYADQPHLTRECLRLTGMSPGAFLGAVQQTCACGHDHAASFAPLLRSRAPH
jgi:AraC-like DNA-binding protein